MDASETAPASWLARSWARLKDLDKPPRRWWYPPSSRRAEVSRLPEAARPDDQEVVGQAHEKFSETVRLAMLSLLGFALFCLLITLSTPDSSLLVADPSIKMPFVDVQVSFLSFLILAPFLLIVITLYLHIFYGYWLDLETDYQHLTLRRETSDPPMGRLPTLFSLDHPVPRLLTACIFYWLVPLVLLVITVKAAARLEWGISLVLFTGVVTVTLVFLQIRRCPAPQRRWNIPRWGVMALIVGGMAAITVQLLAHAGLVGGSSAERTELVVVPQWLPRPLNIVRADLKGKWLTAVNLRDGCARLAKLQGANLRGADLRRADLRGADLRDANFYGAKLRRAMLGEAMLKGVDFRRADLREVDFAGATLKRANLQEAHLKGAQNLKGKQLARVVKTLFKADLDQSLDEEIQQTDPQLLNAPVPANVKAKSQIDSPHDGEKVGKKITVHGSLGRLPSNGRLWLAVKKGDLIWPKEPEVPVTDSSWTVTVYEEGTRSGDRFELVLYLVEDEVEAGGHQQILKWLRDSNAADAFPGLKEIPRSHPLATIQLRMMLPGC